MAASRALRAYYRELGVHDMDLGPVRTMARELAIWMGGRAGLDRGRGGKRELEMGEKVCSYFVRGMR